MPLANLAQQIFNRNFAVVQNDWAGRGAANAHLVLFTADRESGKILFYQKAVNFSPSTFANTVNRSANPALVIHIFSPFKM